MFKFVAFLHIILCGMFLLRHSVVLYCDYVLLYKLKQKRQQRKADIAEPAVPKKQSECHTSKDTMTDVSAATTLGLTAGHKRKRTSDMCHDDDVPGKRLKFSSLFTNNPKIPHVDR